ncbi:MAG: class I SAM-dependent methyltransferase [Nitrospiraceae bacterium]|nr:class I SAM-dependent methyltransferase [Nitrospiraceae bacterium]
MITCAILARTMRTKHPLRHPSPREIPMSISDPLYPRGKIAGVYPSLSSRRDEAYIEFVEDARNALLHGQQAPIAAYSRELLKKAGASMAPDKASCDAAEKILMQDPALKTYYRVKRSLQESFWNGIRRSFDSRRDSILQAMSAAAERGPGSAALNPNMPLPEYSQAQIHLQPGAYAHEELAGLFYDYGLKVFMGGAADNDNLPKMVARIARMPADGKVRRVLDLGCSAGATTTGLKLVHLDAEVIGIDIAAPMVRYAHLRAVEQNIDVQFKQMNAEKMDFPDQHFDAVLAMLLFHELPPEASKRVLEESFRVLRPGGALTILDSPVSNTVTSTTCGLPKWTPKTTASRSCRLLHALTSKEQSLRSASRWSRTSPRTACVPAASASSRSTRKRRATDMSKNNSADELAYVRDLPGFKPNNPVYFEQEAIDHLIGIVLELGGELWTLRDRMAYMEELLRDSGSAVLEKLDAGRPSDALQAKLSAERKEFISRVYSRLYSRYGGDKAQHTTAPM